MCINRIYYGEEAISRIERNEEGKRNWLSKKEKKKVKKVSLWKITKESFDLNALCEFPNLEVIEIAGFDEFKPLELKHIEVLYQFRRLKCLRLSSCLIPEPIEKGKWKHLRTLEIDFLTFLYNKYKQLFLWLICTFYFRWRILLWQIKRFQRQ